MVYVGVSSIFMDCDLRNSFFFLLRKVGHIFKLLLEPLPSRFKGWNYDFRNLGKVLIKNSQFQEFLVKT